MNSLYVAYLVCLWWHLPCCCNSRRNELFLRAGGKFVNISANFASNPKPSRIQQDESYVHPHAKRGFANFISLRILRTWKCTQNRRFSSVSLFPPKPKPSPFCLDSLIWEACGTSTRWICTKCEVPLCVTIKRSWSGCKCVFLYHNELFFGLARTDYVMVLKRGWNEGDNKTKKEIEQELVSWRPPTEAALERNACFIKRLQAELQADI